MPTPHEVDRNMIVPTTLTETDLRFHDVRSAPFAIYGLYHPQTEPVFKRLPDEIGLNTNHGVKTLYLHTAGGRVRFSTDSAYVAIKAMMPYVDRMDHMPLSSSAGFDLYLDTDEGSRFVHAFRVPNAAQDGYESITRFPDRKMRSFTINFPSYNALNALYIGLQEDAVLGEGHHYRDKLPIVYYGSSITQGGCCSRPGLSYQNIIARRLDYDYINLGFSGSGRAEETIARYMATLPMSVFVCDYDHNAPTTEYLAETHYRLYSIIREINPTVPYIMISRPDFLLHYDDCVARRAVILDSYARALAEGDKNVYFIDGQSFFRGRDEDSCTVDGCHPNDLGFHKMADHIERVIVWALENHTT